jgi:hypothetical protein
LKENTILRSWGGAISMVLKNQKLFVARLSGLWLHEIMLVRPKKKIFPAEKKWRERMGQTPSIELLYLMYKLMYIDMLGLLKYICDVVLFLLCCVDGECSEQVKHDAIVKRLARHSPWAFTRDTL